MSKLTKFVKTYGLSFLQTQKLSLSLLLGIGVITHGISSSYSMQPDRGYGEQSPYSVQNTGDLTGHGNMIQSQLDQTNLGQETYLNIHEIDAFGQACLDARQYNLGRQYFKKFSEAFPDRVSGPANLRAVILGWLAVFEKANGNMKAQNIIYEALSIDPYFDKTALSYKIFHSLPKPGQSPMGYSAIPARSPMTPQNAYPPQQATMNFNLEAQAQSIQGQLNTPTSSREAMLGVDDINSFGQACFEAKNYGLGLQKFSLFAGSFPYKLTGPTNVHAAILAWRAVFEKVSGNPSAQSTLNQALSVDPNVDKSLAYITFKTATSTTGPSTTGYSAPRTPYGVNSQSFGSMNKPPYHNPGNFRRY